MENPQGEQAMMKGGEQHHDTRPNGGKQRKNFSSTDDLKKQTTSSITGLLAQAALPGGSIYVLKDGLVGSRDCSATSNDQLTPITGNGKVLSP